MLIEGTWYGCSMWLLLVAEIHKKYSKQYILDYNKK
jgi:hypothetical protein